MAGIVRLFSVCTDVVLSPVVQVVVGVAVAVAYPRVRLWQLEVEVERAVWSALDSRVGRDWRCF